MSNKKKPSIRDELIQYCNDIIGGKIIACQKHIWACQRFLKDIDRIGSDDFPYVFNPEMIINGEKDYPADRYFRWMRMFKHSKGPLEGQQKEPVIYEKFVYGNIYGWVHKDTYLRRFRRSYEQLARKNASDLAL